MVLSVLFAMAVALGTWVPENVTSFDPTTLCVRDDDEGRSNGLVVSRIGGEALDGLRGKAVWLSCRVKQEASSSAKGIGIALVAETGDRNGTVRRTASTGRKGALGKTELRVKMTVPEDAQTLKVVLRCADGWNATGVARFSDIILTDDLKDIPPVHVTAAAELMDFTYRIKESDYTAEERKYRESYLNQMPTEEDGRTRPTIRNGTWYMDGKPVFWIGGWLHGNRTTDWPVKDPDRQGIGHVAYTTPPSAGLFEKIGFNSSQISHAPVQAGRALMGLPISGGKKGFEETEREDADFIRGFGDLQMVVDFAYGFAAEVPKADRAKLDQVTDWWHLFIPFCPEHPEGNRYYESYFLGGTRTLMRYGMNVFIYELFNESSYCCACPANVQAFALAMKRKYGTIAAANAQWGTDFDSFRDVAVRTGFSDAAGAYYDWCIFMGDRYAELLRKYKATVRSVDRRKNVYFTEQSAGEPPHRPGIDYRKVAAALDVLTLEGGWRYGWRKPEPPFGTEHSFTLDFYRALSKDVKPVMNNEHYCGRFENGVRVPSRREDFITSFWQETMHGVSGNFSYNWDKRSWEWKTPEAAREVILRKNDYKSYSLLNPYAMPPEHLDAFQLFRNELEPYRERLLPMPRTKPATVAVLFSYPTLWRAKAAWNENEAVRRTGDWYARILHAQIPVKIVFDEDLASLGREIEWLVLPAASRCADETVDAMRRFVARGGRIAAAVDALEKTVWERMRKPEERPQMSVFVDGNACIAEMLRKGVTRWATLEALDGDPLTAADVQVCDRGDFKFVSCVEMNAKNVRRVRLRLNVGGGRFRMRTIPDGRVTTVDITQPIEFDLPAQERRIFVFER